MGRWSLILRSRVPDDKSIGLFVKKKIRSTIVSENRGLVFSCVMPNLFSISFRNFLFGEALA